MKNLLFIFAASILLYSCTTYVPVSNTPTAARVGQDDKETITSSLFEDVNRQLSEEDVAALLDGQIRYADEIRIAVFYYTIESMNFGKMGYGYTKPSPPDLQEDYISLIKNVMAKSPRVSRVVLIPSLLAANSSGISQIRESAARMQCDMVLIIKAESDLYRDVKLFKKDEVKAYATCEALLLDTRTTVVPFTDVITTNATLTRSEDDATLGETQKKAEKEAIRKAIIGVAQTASAFIGDLE
ncbi:MAG: hypothetical protein WBB45_01520 [Cyclobacteriaceae bacterium]